MSRAQSLGGRNSGSGGSCCCRRGHARGPTCNSMEWPARSGTMRISVPPCRHSQAGKSHGGWSACREAGAAQVVPAAGARQLPHRPCTPRHLQQTPASSPRRQPPCRQQRACAGVTASGGKAGGRMPLSVTAPNLSRTSASSSSRECLRGKGSGQGCALEHAVFLAEAHARGVCPRPSHASCSAGGHGHRQAAARFPNPGLAIHGGWLEQAVEPHRPHDLLKSASKMAWPPVGLLLGTRCQPCAMATTGLGWAVGPWRGQPGHLSLPAIPSGPWCGCCCC